METNTTTIQRYMGTIFTKYTILLFSVVALFFLFSLQSSAQTLTTQIVVTPESPRGSEEFSVGVVSSAVDLNRSTISWYLNDKLGLSGIGKTGFTSRTGPVGTEFQIRAVIETLNGQTIVRNTLVRPQEVDVLWKAHSYTPPFYKGKALAPSAGFIVLTAMPNMMNSRGELLNPASLIYTWSERGVVLGNASGAGKQTIILENGQIKERPLLLSLSVESRDGTIIAKENRIEIPVNEPQVLYYEKLPLEGVWYAKTLTEFAMEKEEVVLRAEPFHFSLDDVANDVLSYEWKVNGREIETPEKKNEITFRSDGREGVARVELEMRDMNLPFRVLQKAKSVVELYIQ